MKTHHFIEHNLKIKQNHKDMESCGKFMMSSKILWIKNKVIALLFLDIDNYLIFFDIEDGRYFYKNLQKYNIFSYKLSYNKSILR